MEEKILKTLDEFNEQRAQLHNKNLRALNGIACPKCGNELEDSSPRQVFATYPPKIGIKCSNCDFTGTRIK